MRIEVDLPPEVFAEIVAEAKAQVLAELREDREAPAEWLYGDKKLADAFGLPLGTVQKLADRLPHRRVGTRKLYNRTEVAAWLDEQGRR